MNLSSQFAGTIEQTIIKNAALDRKHPGTAGWETCPDRASADRDEVHCLYHRMRPVGHVFGQAKSLQYRQAGWVDAVAADFFAWKFFTLEQNSS